MSCCPPDAPPPVQVDPFVEKPTLKGKIEPLGEGLEGYVVTGTKPAAIIIVYDIFGYDYFPQIKQTADRLSTATGFTVAVPDFFRGKPWTMDRFPPKPEDNLMGWITDVGSWGKASKDVYNTVDALKARGCRGFGIVGCCWGASIALHAGADAATFSAAGGWHPTLFGKEEELAAAVQVPVALVSTKGDPLESVEVVVAKRPALAANSVFKRFDDVPHGFTAARGDFRDPLNVRRVGEAVQLMAEFFTANVPASA